MNKIKTDIIETFLYKYYLQNVKILKQKNMSCVLHFPKKLSRKDKVVNVEADKKMYVIPKLDILLDPASKRALKFLTKRCFPIRRRNKLLFYFYMFLLGNKYLEKSIIPEIMYIQGLQKFPGELVFSQHGNKIKIFNFETRVIYNLIINKIDLLEAEIKARLNYCHIVNIPKILSYNIEEGWFSEEFIDAFPPNRLDKKINILHLCLPDLIQFYEKNKLEPCKTNEYLNSLLMRLQNDVENSSIIEKKRFIQIIENAFDYINNYNHSKEMKTFITTIHGDLQLDNILFLKEEMRYYLIDWEYTRKASVLYDIFNFFSLNLLRRNKSPIKELLIKENKAYKGIFTQFNEVVDSEISADYLKYHYAIYLLERLCFNFKNKYFGDIERWFVLLDDFVKTIRLS